MLYFALLSLVQAEVLYPKAMQGDMPLQRVDRNLVLPKGVFEIQTNAIAKISTGYRDIDGQIQSYSTGVWNHNQAHLRISHGLSPRISVYMDVPFVYARWLPQGMGDSNISTLALGDVRSGFFYQPDKRLCNSTTQYAYGMELKAASGVEWPTSNYDGPFDISGFLTGSGVTNIKAHTQLQRKLSEKTATTLSLGYAYKVRAVVGYIVETGGFGNGIIKPGNELEITATQLWQLTDKVTISPMVHASYRSKYQIGVSGPTVWWTEKHELLPHQYFVDVGTAFGYDFSTRFAMNYLLEYQAMGTTTQTFAVLGIEEFSPQPGLRMQIDAVWRR